jgi:hypothetical protein
MSKRNKAVQPVTDPNKETVTESTPVLPQEPVTEQTTTEVSEPITEIRGDIAIMAHIDEAPFIEPPVVTEPQTVSEFIIQKHRLKHIPFEIQSIIDALEKYAQFMNPRCPNTSADMLKYQHSLQRSILSAITMRDTKNNIEAGIDAANGSYIVALDIVMWFFNKYKDAAFSELALHRCLQDLRIDKKQYTFLQLLLTAICMIVNNPAEKRRIKWGAITRELDNSDYQHRVLAYFVNS